MKWDSFLKELPHPYVGTSTSARRTLLCRLGLCVQAAEKSQGRGLGVSGEELESQLGPRRAWTEP